MRTDSELLEEIETANDGDGPDPIATITIPELAQIAVAAMGVTAAETRLDESVGRARAAGLTWQQIGEVLGMTRQGALKRFRDNVA